MGKSPDEQPFLAAYLLRLAKFTLVPITCNSFLLLPYLSLFFTLCFSCFQHYNFMSILQPILELQGKQHIPLESGW